MSKQYKTRLAWVIIAIVTTIVSITLGVTYPLPPALTGADVTLGATHFTNVSAEDVTISDDLTVADAAAITGDLTITGSLSPSGPTILSSESVTPTAGQTITPNTTLLIINSSGAVSMTLAACTDTGTVLITYGDDANTVTINDTHIKTNDGAAQTLGQYDAITWICAASLWIELSDSPNS